MPLRKSDFVDLDFLDAYELGSDGYSSYLSTTLVSTNVSKLITINLPSDGEGILLGADHLAEVGDIVLLTGTSTADGYYQIDNIISDTTFSVVQSINNSTGGNISFIYKSGALNIGFDNSNSTHITHKNVQQAIQDLDQAITGTTTALDSDQHKVLRQLIHLADGVGGPFEGFASGAYREVYPNDFFPISIIWWNNLSKSKKYVEKTITYNSSMRPISFEWKAYDTDGNTLLSTVTDSITYVGFFEVSRIRTIVDATAIPGALDTSTHKYLRQLIHLVDGVGGPFEGFTSGAYREIIPSSNIFPTSTIWYEDITKAKKIVEKTVNYNTNKTVSLITWKVYDTDGSTVLATVVDSLNYNGIIETNRTRTIS